MIVERLGWDEFRGVPIVSDDMLPTGRFRLVCSGLHGAEDQVDAVAVQSGSKVHA